MTIEQLKRGERVNVDTIPFFIFLFRDGTILCMLTLSMSNRDVNVNRHCHLD